MKDSEGELLRLPTAEKWSCSFCTYLNPQQLTVCEMCAGERGTSPEGVEAASTSSLTLSGTLQLGVHDEEKLLHEPPKTHRDVAVRLFTLMEKLARCRLQSSTFSDAGLSEPYIVEISSAVFDKIFDMLSTVLKPSIEPEPWSGARFAKKSQPAQTPFQAQCEAHL